jgi:glutathione S-transferase
VEGVTKPSLPNLERWFAQFAARPGFARFIAPPMT